MIHKKLVKYKYTINKSNEGATFFSQKQASNNLFTD